MYRNPCVRVVTVAALILKASCATAATVTLGTTNLTVAASGGTDTLGLGVSPSSSPWSAASGSPWLHLSASGVGNAFISFTFDANPGTALRTGTLTVAGQAVTVTQMGSGSTARSKYGTLQAAT
ncbi:MAG TPA: BACON domain-containing carbohydrate-binding protein [Verrucomicrobiae bacterium]|nr:BACON domain-containing carbohydrate-binding protein [Verrucomicrobiae bacterium]